MTLKPTLFTIIIGLLLVISALVSTSESRLSISNAQEQGEHCVVYAEATAPGSSAAPVVWRGCYPTFAEAIAVATDGGQLPPSSSEDHPTDAQSAFPTASSAAPPVSESNSDADESRSLPGGVSAQGEHCVVYAEATAPGSSAAPVVWRGCYPTFAEAIAVATDGRVHLPPSASPDDLSDDMLHSQSATDVHPAQSSFVLTIEYDDTNYRGASLTTTGNMPCPSDGSAFLLPSLGAWNNRIESVRLYSNCNRAFHYENESYGGNYGDYRSDTPDMTSMRNQASSLKICQNCLAR